jgi:chaperone modulatory protein CbpM
MNGLDRYAVEFGVTVEQLTVWVERQWILPVQSGGKILFDAADKARLKMVVEFHRDLDIDDETMPVVLALIDRLHAARARVNDLLQALADLPEPQRTAISMRIQGLLNE